MYRVMIVDDEEPVLESFSYLMGKGIPGFELCGVARSGPEAIALVPELKPDLVFMDIQMPGMDGIEAIGAIQKNAPQTIFILSTAYERFDIAQKAIPLGVFNYLVKPVSRKALTEEFAKVKAALDDARERSDLQLDEARYAQRMREEEKRRFLLGLAWISPDPESWSEYSRLFSIKGDYGAVLLFKIVNPLPEAELESLYRAFIQQLQYKRHCLSAILAGQVIVLFPEAGEGAEHEALIERAAAKIGKLEYRFGLGKARHFSALGESYREAFEQLRDFEGREASPSRSRKEMRELCEAFVQSDWEDVRARYERFWTDIFVSNEFLVAKAKMIEFFANLMGSLDRDLKIRCEVEMDPAEEIIGLGSVASWERWSAYTMDRLRFIIRENKDHYYPRPLGLAVNYINENYGKPLQLSAVAERCEISPGYLSRLFSEYLNTTFIDYLNKLRINEAVRLLGEKNKAVKDVCYLVGYSDPNYFSRIFKKYTGVSPSELAKGGASNEA